MPSSLLLVEHVNLRLELLVNGNRLGGVEHLREGQTMYGHTCSKGKDQPGKVANPARGQLNRENA